MITTTKKCLKELITRYKITLFDLGRELKVVDALNSSTDSFNPVGSFNQKHL